MDWLLNERVENSSIKGGVLHSQTIRPERRAGTHTNETTDNGASQIRRGVGRLDVRTTKRVALVVVVGTRSNVRPRTDGKSRFLIAGLETPGRGQKDNPNLVFYRRQADGKSELRDLATACLGTSLVRGRRCR